jgi:tRNA dimethylallyltransferase
MDAPLIVIVGETASGKTELAIFLAEKFNGEIINADSWSVYKGFNIGTAKPTERDRKKIRHYLIDIADPMIGFSAAEFKKEAITAIEEISSKRKVPILVGGTGLYIDSVIYDYSFLPPSTWKERVMYESMDLNELQILCAKLGYDLGSIDKNNKRRVIRLLENKGVFPTSKPIRNNTLLLGMHTNPDMLKVRIENRTQKMLNIGLESEVRNLSEKYGWEIEPMKGIGYREFKDFFENKATHNELIKRINLDTLKLVKKQNTWFKRNKSIHWHTNRLEIVDEVTTFMNKFK